LEINGKTPGIGMKDKLKSVLLQARYLRPTLRLIWSATPGWTTAWAIVLVVQGLLPAAFVYLTKLLVDSLLAALKGGGDWTLVKPALFLTFLTCAVMLVGQTLESVNDWIRTAQSELIQDSIKDLLHEKATSLDISFYESPEFHDRLEQARGEASNRPLALLESFGSLAQSAITLLAMAAMLTPYGLWLPLILFLSTLPAFYVVLHFDRRYHQWWQSRTTTRRWAHYYDVILTDNYAASELRLFGLAPRFRSEYGKLRQLLRTERVKQMQRQSLARLGAAVVALATTGPALIWMGWRTLNGSFTLGDLALFYQALTRGQGLIQTLLRNLGKIYTNTLFLGNLFKFLEFEPRIAEPADPAPVPTELKRGIEFNDITFSYPGSARASLQDFNLFVPAGAVVAIVGANGAGKTTLLKLLCRFYDPQSGSIKLDGVDLCKMRPRDLWERLTVLFQEPVDYHASASESIAMGEFKSRLAPAEIEAAAQSAGAHDFIARLPQGYDTLLGKWFGVGAELSGGEWQRIATARAYLRRSPIILLDEPTSFMDSWSESDWFARFRTLAQGRTAIVITHRFTIAMRADVIHVMGDGNIVESGSHQELVAQGGLYAQSWVTQMAASMAPNGNNNNESQVGPLPVGNEAESVSANFTAPTF
jgi:ATP-binding cassette, subfamily B, bacterial